MAANDILCATDFTPASDAALKYAGMLARRTGAGITLLHLKTTGGHGPQEKQDAHNALALQMDRCRVAELALPLLAEGSVVQGIADHAAEGHSLLVIGTHGAKGLRQSLFGADMLKVARRSAVPVLVVQEGSAVREPEQIVLPVAAHAGIERLLDAVCVLAKAFTSEVHIYQLSRPNETVSEELLANKDRMIERLRNEGLRWESSLEPSTTFSIGFAGPTIEYAERVGGGLIAVMAHASDEYRYMADAEKERLLMNPARIPVLFA